MCTICAAFNPFHDDCSYGVQPELDGTTTAPQAGADGTEGTTVETTDASNNTSTSSEFAVGTFFRGELTGNSDSDWIAVELEAGKTYTFAMVGIGALDDQVNDSYLRLRDANGNEIASNDDVDGSGGSVFRYSHITYTSQTNQTVYMDAQSWNNTDDGEYGLSVVEGEFATYDVWMGAGALLRPAASWANTTETGVNLTWAFRATQNPGGTNSADNNNPSTFQQLSAAQEAAVTQAINYIGAVTGVNFTQVAPGGNSDNATILFGAYNTNDGAGAYAWFPGTYGDRAGDVWLNEAGGFSNDNLPIGSYSYFTILHEMGHALGLAHPGTYDATDGGPISYNNSALFQEDSQQYTVMSYFDESFTGGNINQSGNWQTRYPDTLLLHDLLALHQLYGADNSYNAGNTTYGFNASKAGSVYDFTTNTDPFLTIWDGAGTDTLDLSGYNGSQSISLVEATFSDVMGFTGTLSIAAGAKIENAIGGAGADTITGNSLNNDIDGNDGDDSIDGGSGKDSLRGGLGDDSIWGGADRDIILGDNGNDNLFGEMGNDVIRGGNGSDAIDGGNGNDRLFGGNSGDDTITGGSGDDLIRAGNGSDVIFGGDGDDFIVAGAGFDVIDGGAGDDEMTGAFNADTFVFGNGHGNDTITDFAADNDFEVLDFSGLSSLNNLNDVLGPGGAASQQGANVLIDTGGGNSILLLGVSIGDLDANDFNF